MQAITAGPQGLVHRQAGRQAGAAARPAAGLLKGAARAAGGRLQFLSSQAGRCPEALISARPARQARGKRVAAMAAADPGIAGGAGDVVVSVDELKSTCFAAIKTYGYTDAEATIMLDVMMYAQLRGNNQGIIKVTTGGIAKDKNCRPIEIEHETRLSALLDGNNSAGMLALYQGAEMAVEKAKANGFGIVGTHGTFTSTGALGYYCKKVADEGLIAIVLAQSPEFVAPHGALEPIFGTNPIGVAVPTPNGPMVMDMATAAYAYFGLLEAKTAGTKIPKGVARDAVGNVTEDPNEALDGGAIQVFDQSYKGSNLSLVVELLAGPLVGAAIADKMEEKNWGNLVAAIDPKLMGSSDEFQKRVQVVLSRVKSARKLPNVDEIFLPGERGDGLAKRRLAANKIPVEPNLWKNLCDMAGKAAPPPQGPTPSGALKIDTQLQHPEMFTSVKDPYASTNPPLYQTATFGQPTATTNGEYDYTRSGNPTRTMLEEQMAAVDGGTRGFAFASGMAALMCVTRLVKTGEKIVTGDDIYGGTSRLLEQVVPKQGVTVVNVDTLDLEAMRRAITPDTRLVMLESPTNPRLQITDIKAISEMAHAAGALVCVDNSIMAPVFQRPLDLGADICMTSTTKFVSGQSDTTGGILTVKNEQLGKDIYFHQNAEGIHLAPFDCWLCLRGIKTMALRMQRQQENAQKIAEYLDRHPLVDKVNYPGLPGHPGNALHYQQASGAGSILSFSTGNIEAAKAIVEETKLFKITVSFGNVTSLISLPCFMSHASIPAEIRAARGLPDDLIRISVGIEDADDLIADLDRAMTLGAAAAGISLGSSQAGGQDIRSREEELLQRISALEAKLGDSAPVSK